MKSSFLLTALVTALTATVASAQISTRPSPKDMEPQKTTFDKFSDRIRISYFGILTTPSWDDMMNGHWNNAAISDEFDTEGANRKFAGKHRDTYPTNVWNQLAFSYNFGAKLSFVVAPRWMTPLAHSVDMKAPEDRSFIALEDALVGFAGVIYSSDDKAFNLWIRPGVRLPVSRASRNGTSGGAGNLSHQNELAYNATYNLNKTWQLGLFGQFRHWVVEDRFAFDRLRIYTAPYVQYTIDDISRVQVYYENMLETDRRSQPVDRRDPKFYDVWQNVMIGYSRDITPKFNVMPFFSTFINDAPITDKSVWLGAWISYSFK